MTPPRSCRAWATQPAPATMLRMRSHARAALALALLLALSACTEQEAENFFLHVILFCFGALASVGSMLGAIFALLHVAERRPRSYVNFAIAIPFAVVALVLHALTTNGFTLAETGFDRSDI